MPLTTQIVQHCIEASIQMEETIAYQPTRDFLTDTNQDNVIALTGTHPDNVIAYQPTRDFLTDTQQDNVIAFQPTRDWLTDTQQDNVIA